MGFRKRVWSRGGVSGVGTEPRETDLGTSGGSGGVCHGSRFRKESWVDTFLVHPPKVPQSPWDNGGYLPQGMGGRQRSPHKRRSPRSGGRREIVVGRPKGPRGGGGWGVVGGRLGVVDGSGHSPLRSRGGRNRGRPGLYSGPPEPIRLSSASATGTLVVDGGVSWADIKLPPEEVEKTRVSLGCGIDNFFSFSRL